MLRDTDPCILHGEANLRPGIFLEPPYTKCHRSLFSELHGVAHQVQQHLAHTSGVAYQLLRSPVLQVPFKAQAMIGRLRLEESDYSRDDASQTDRKRKRLKSSHLV